MLPIPTDHSSSRKPSLHIHKLSLQCYPLNSPFPQNTDPNAGPSAPNSALSELQAQLQETQVSLASHVDKIRSLDNLLAEHEVIKGEVTSLRELMEEEKRELERARGGHRLAEPHQQHTEDDDGDLHQMMTTLAA
jgi:hypothetical protein